MQTGSTIAIKEWAVVCEALRQGRQCVLLRKGGIAEGPKGFRPEHAEFWLYPTRFHQSPEEIVESARDLLKNVEARRPPEGQLRIDLYAGVQSVELVTDESQLADLRGQHVLTDDAVRQRFHYRRPGLYVMRLKVSELPEPLLLEEKPEYAGCHSWVGLDDERLGRVEMTALRPCSPSDRR